MTAPSNANTSGLEVVAFRVHDWADGWIYFEDEYWAGRECKDDDREPQPLVTAASAQARIAELEADVNAAHAAGRFLIKAAEARADRLAKALEDISSGYANCDDFQDAQDIARAALQQETQP